MIDRITWRVNKVQFDAAKCPTCGATIQVQTDALFAFCSSCGNRLEPKKAIADYVVQLKGGVTIEGVSIENDLLRGKQCLESKDWKKAFEVFNFAINKQANNAEAWEGCLAAMTHCYSTVDQELFVKDGERGVRSILQNLIKYSNAEQIKVQIFNLRELNSKLESKFEKSKRSNEILSRKSKQLFGILGIVLVLGFKGFSDTQAWAWALYFFSPIAAGIYYFAFFKPVIMDDRETPKEIRIVPDNILHEFSSIIKPSILASSNNAKQVL
jgi:hypothetical protein